MAVENPFAPVMGSTGAQSPPTPNPGDMAQGMTMVGSAVQMLQQALQFFPIGDDMQKAVIDSIQKLSKMAPPSAQVPGVQATNLTGLTEQAQKNAIMLALQRAMSGPDSGAATPPSPMAGAAGPMI